MRPRSGEVSASAQQRPDRNHGALPGHLPRYEVVIDVENHDCPCCGGAPHVIMELRDRTTLDITPAQLRARHASAPLCLLQLGEGAVVVCPSAGAANRWRHGH